MPSTLLPRLLTAVALVLATAGPVIASTSLSPSEVLADIDVTLTLRTTTDPLDPTTQVTASHPGELIPIACGAPDGWSCSLGDTQTVWTRGASLAADDTFTLAVHTPAGAAELPIAMTDTRTSGASSTSTATLTVLAPEPEPSESTAEPTESPTASETPAAPAEPVPAEPFRPPSNGSDDPIPISDLPSENPDDRAGDPVAERVIPSSPLAVQTVLMGIVALLLLLSATGFFVARSNR